MSTPSSPARRNRSKLRPPVPASQMMGRRSMPGYAESEESSSSSTRETTRSQTPVRQGYTMSHSQPSSVARSTGLPPTPRSDSRVTRRKADRRSSMSSSGYASNSTSTSSVNTPARPMYADIPRSRDPEAPLWEQCGLPPPAVPRRQSAGPPNYEIQNFENDMGERLSHLRVTVADELVEYRRMRQRNVDYLKQEIADARFKIGQINSILEIIRIESVRAPLRRARDGMQKRIADYEERIEQQSAVAAVSESHA